MKYQHNYYKASNNIMHPHHMLPKYYIGDPNHTFDYNYHPMFEWKGKSCPT